MEDRLIQRIKGLEGELIDLRRDFHMYPELGFREFETAKKVEAYLKTLGLETSRVAKTGVTAVLDSGKPGPVLMIRADMDALPVTEENDVEYKSKNPGVMHACGHDAHMAMLLVAAKVLCENTESFCGKIKFVFQPDEEVAGAVAMVNEGVLENPDVDAAVAIHVWTPVRSGKISITQGAVMGGLDVFKVVITGSGGHTGYPDKAVDPVIAASSVIQTVQTIQTREIDTQKPTIIMFGKISGGSKANIIPEKVELEGSIRFLYDTGPGTPEQPSDRFRRIVEGVCGTHRCGCDITIERENIPVVNDEKMVKLAVDTATDVFGSLKNVETGRFIASEDFSEFSTRVPGVLMFLGASNSENKKEVPHHNPGFDIDENVLVSGVLMHVQGALSYLKTGG